MDQAKAARFSRSLVFRYGLAVLLFLTTIGLSLGLSRLGLKLNFTIPIVLALLAAAWYGGRGPGLILSVLFQATTIIFATPAQGTGPYYLAFTYFSTLSLYIFLVLMISHLREVHHRLRQQRDLLEVTLDSIGDGVVATDLSGRVVFMNPVAQQLTGWPSDEARGQELERVMKIIKESTREEAVSPIRRVLHTGLMMPTSNHSLLIGRDGRELPIDNTASPIRDGKAIKGVVMVFSDVSERKRSQRFAEHRAKEIAAQYDLSESLQHAPTMDEAYLAALNSIFVTLECDRAAILLFDDQSEMRFVASRGISEEYKAAVSGHSPWKPSDIDARPFGMESLETEAIEPGLKQIIAGEGIASLGFIPLTVSERVIGKLMVYYNSEHRFSSSEFEMAMTVANQIASGVDKRLTSQRLRENEERLRLATQTGKVGVWDWDIRADHVEWTDAVYTMHGLKKGEFGGSAASFTSLVHREDRELVKMRIEQALAGSVDYELEFRVQKPNNEIGWLFTNAVVLRDADGPFRMIGATTDISERIKAEASKRESEIMHRLVEAQESERKRIARDLHDHLGQRMTALRLNIGTLAKTFADHQDVRKAISELEASAAFVDRDISYLSWELRPTELENLGLVDALRSFVREWSRQYGVPADFHAESNKYYSGEVRLPAEVETNIYRIVQEALNNILKHAQATTVSVLLYIKNEILVIVEDNGVGFVPKSGPQDLAQPGGLGLIGMNERASLLGGTLDIETDTGVGSTIRIRLPLPKPSDKRDKILSASDRFQAAMN